MRLERLEPKSLHLRNLKVHQRNLIRRRANGQLEQLQLDWNERKGLNIVVIRRHNPAFLNQSSPVLVLLNWSWRGIIFGPALVDTKAEAKAGVKKQQNKTRHRRHRGYWLEG